MRRGGGRAPYHKRCAYLTNGMRLLGGCLAMVMSFLHVVVSPTTAVHSRSPQTGPMLSAHHTEGAMRCSHTCFTPNALSWQSGSAQQGLRSPSVLTETAWRCNLGSCWMPASEAHMGVCTAYIPDKALEQYGR